MSKLQKLYGLFLSKNKMKIIISIVMVIIAQFLLLITYFLPLKILILLTTTKVPSFLSNLLPGFSRDEIILALTLSIAIVYIFHLLLEKYSETLINKIFLQTCENKTINIRDLEYKYFESFIKILSVGSLMLSLYFIVIYIYPLIGFFIVLYFIIFYFFIYFITFRESIYNTIFKIFSGVGFMLTFFIEIIDYLYINSQDTSVITLLLTLILCRYIFTRSHYLLNKVLFLNNTYSEFIIKLERK